MADCKWALRVNGGRLYDGEKPFFWLGDTAWLMLARLTREEIYLYLKNRAGKGFNVIQTVAAMKAPFENVYGQTAYVDENVACPDCSGGYWELVDFALDTAEALGLYIGLLPTWGSVAKTKDLGASDAAAYGAFLAERYGARKNIIWINGGDVLGTACADFWKEMGRVLKAGSPGRLVTYHPFGRTLASDFFEDEDWLDFDMFQSGHRRYDQFPKTADHDFNERTNYWYGEDAWKYVRRALERNAERPVLDGEPSYENIPQGLHDPAEPYWNAQDVRRYAYWSLLAGASGFTYGHNAIMQFYSFKDGENPAYGCKDHWKDAIHHPGADCITHMKNLFERLPWETGREAQELLACEEGEKHERISAMKGDGFAIFYTYTGRTIEVVPDVFAGEYGAWWINPLTGVRSFAGNFLPGEKQSFPRPKGAYQNNDWLLLLKEGK